MFNYLISCFFKTLTDLRPDPVSFQEDQQLQHASVRLGNFKLFEMDSILCVEYFQVERDAPRDFLFYCSQHALS